MKDISLVMFLPETDFDQSLINELGADGIVRHRCKNGLIVKLPRDIREKYRLRYIIPDCLLYQENRTLRIVAQEDGGTFSGGGTAQIITNDTGLVLAPFRITRKIRDRGPQAEFFTNNQFIAVNAGWSIEKTPHLEIKRISIAQNGGDTAEIKKETLLSRKWSKHEPESRIDLPGELACFEPAVIAAIEKCQCFWCHHLHYANMTAFYPRIIS